MKYTVFTSIKQPREKVVELFEDPENIAKWQKGFVSMQVKEGAPGATGSKTLLQYKMGKREMEMLETITVNNLPEEFTATYEAKGVWNEMKNFFEEDGEGATKWQAEVEFKFKGFMRLVAFFMPGAFKKQTLKSMQDFKQFAETGQPVH